MRHHILKIGLTSGRGRMAQKILEQVSLHKDIEVIAVAVRSGSVLVSEEQEKIQTYCPSAVLTNDLDQLFKCADVVVDFTHSLAVSRHAELAALYQTPLLVGTTGLGDVESTALMEAAQKAAVLHAVNTSLGNTVLHRLVEWAAQALDTQFDAEIIEHHHRHKKDAPSGTSLRLAHEIAKGRGLTRVPVPDHLGRQGERVEGEIGFAVIRGGDTVGTHKVLFAGNGESIELTHTVTDRKVFAEGALRAARWLVFQKPGFYQMQDIEGS